LSGQDAPEKAPNFWAKTLDGDKYTNDTASVENIIEQFKDPDLLS